jgi:ATP-dependent RNA helicase DDX49/DBP8
VTQVLVTKREAEIKLDQQNFGEKRDINRRKEMLIAGLDPDEVEASLRMQKDRRKLASKRKQKAISNTVIKSNRKKKLNK